MKVIQARRERQDKISKLMGDYLLKGYKMLGETCGQCEVSDPHVHHMQCGAAGSLESLSNNIRTKVGSILGGTSVHCRARTHTQCMHWVIQKC